MAVNMMIGGFKPNLNKNIKWLSVCITANSCEAYNQFLQVFIPPPKNYPKFLRWRNPSF